MNGGFEGVSFLVFRVSCFVKGLQSGKLETPITKKDIRSDFPGEARRTAAKIHTWSVFRFLCFAVS